MERDENDDALRDLAVKRIQKRRDFWQHAAVYVLVNSFLVVIWFVISPDAFFWPVFPICGWGIGLLMHAWDAFLATQITEADIAREVERMKR